MLDTRTMIKSVLNAHPHMGSMQAPPRHELYREFAGFMEVFRLQQTQERFKPYEKSGSGHIIVIPGFANPDLFTYFIRRQLTRAGYKAHGWGLGVNKGNIDVTIPILIQMIERLNQKNGGPIIALGWSLGGLIAREITRQRPDLISRVITMGTPVVGGPKYTTVNYWYQQLGYDPNELEERLIARYATPIERPITAYYSKNDHVVDWQACIDPYSPHVNHIEVEASHFGMGFSPDVFLLILEELAEQKKSSL